MPQHNTGSYITVTLVFKFDKEVMDVLYMCIASTNPANSFQTVSLTKITELQVI